MADIPSSPEEEIPPNSSPVPKFEMGAKPEPYAAHGASGSRGDHDIESASGFALGVVDPRRFESWVGADIGAIGVRSPIPIDGVGGETKSGARGRRSTTTAKMAASSPRLRGRLPGAVPRSLDRPRRKRDIRPPR